MNEKKYPVFQEGDRVIGTDAFDGNNDIVGMPGTIRLVVGTDMYSVEYDERIQCGHSCGISIQDGYGWFTHAKALAPYEDVPVENIAPMAYDEMMI